MKAVLYLLARLREPSTWAGIASVLVGMGLVQAGAPILDQLPTIGMTLAGTAAILLPEAAKAINAGASSAAGSSKTQAHPLITLAALALILPLFAGGCMWTLSNGDQVVLTPANAVPLVIDRIKSDCAAYDANKVTADALADIATKAINNETVTNANATVRDIATAACPLLVALIQTPKASDPSSSSSSTPPAAAPPASSPAPAPSK